MNQKLFTHSAVHLTLSPIFQHISTFIQYLLNYLSILFPSIYLSLQHPTHPFIQLSINPCFNLPIYPTNSHFTLFTSILQQPIHSLFQKLLQQPSIQSSFYLFNQWPSVLLSINDPIYFYDQPLIYLPVNLFVLLTILYSIHQPLTVFTLHLFTLHPPARFLKSLPPSIPLLVYSSISNQCLHPPTLQQSEHPSTHLCNH